MTFNLFLGGSRAQSQAAQAAFYDEALAAIRSLPDVRDAGAAVTLPIGGDDFSAAYVVEGRPIPPRREQPSAGYQVVTPHYFAAMGIPLLAGRDFTPGDTRAAMPVAIVNRTFATREWAGLAPIGRRIRTGSDSPWMTVVGVVGDVRHRGPSTPPRPEFYQPHTQRSFSFMLFGGDCTMLGSAFAGTEEAPGEVVHKSVVLPESQKTVKVPFKVLRGMASLEAIRDRLDVEDADRVELEAIGAEGMWTLDAARIKSP